MIDMDLLLKIFIVVTIVVCAYIFIVAVIDLIRTRRLKKPEAVAVASVETTEIVQICDSEAQETIELLEEELRLKDIEVKKAKKHRELEKEAKELYRMANDLLLDMVKENEIVFYKE